MYSAIGGSGELHSSVSGTSELLCQQAFTNVLPAPRDLAVKSACVCGPGEDHDLVLLPQRTAYFNSEVAVGCDECH